MTHFFRHTPESRLQRNDSKNPATTCRGLTTNGAHCRRALAQPSPLLSPNRGNGVLATLEDENLTGKNMAAFYCWQHKDQAEHLLVADKQKTKLVQLKERTSVDTLVDRLGIVSLDDEVTKQKRHHRSRRKHERLLQKRDTLPPRWHDIQSPLITVPEDILQVPSKPRQSQRPKHGRSNVKASFLCCVRADDSDLPPVRRHDETHDRQPARLSPVHPHANTVHGQDAGQPGQRQQPMIQRKPVSSAQRTPLVQSTIYPDLHLDSSDSSWNRPQASDLPRSKIQQTRDLLKLIPNHLTPTTTSQLLSELSKPIAPTDDAGYIYIFWLTPDTEPSKPDDDTASSLLEPLTSVSMNARDRERRQGDALRRYASQGKSAAQSRTVLLKIGRAANVHRRLSQWTKQCGKNLTLIRYYPYVPTSTMPSHSPQQEPGAASTPCKVPHVNRVERLIHVELSDKRVTDQGPCATCGREHREWFEIPATREGLKVVDEIVRRWVGWAESAG